jgi:hypothetical protein
MEQVHDVRRYVEAALALHGFEPDPARLERVVASFMATAELAAPLLDWRAPDEAEPASVFKP